MIRLDWNPLRISINGLLTKDLRKNEDRIELKQAGLSWGSVQAETVRLQRQSDPGLIDIYF